MAKPKPRAENKIPALTLYMTFCKLLDAGRARMGNGELSDRVCKLCEEDIHRPGRSCPCACHESWELRRSIERLLAVDDMEVTEQMVDQEKQDSALDA